MNGREREGKKRGVKGWGVCERGRYGGRWRGECEQGGRVLRAIMRNFFGYAVISAVLKRKRLLICYSRKVAKTDLYNERKREGRKEEGGDRKGGV